jgi:hypothetical protein
MTKQCPICKKLFYSTEIFVEGKCYYCAVIKPSVDSIDPVVRCLRQAEETIAGEPHGQWKDVSENQLKGEIKCSGQD